VALRPVYSVQFLCLAPLLAHNFVEVPEGSIMVVRDIDVFEASGDASTFMAWEGPSGNTLWLVAGQTAPTTRTYQWRGRQVFNPGESWDLHSISGTWDAQVSGYLLSTP
jgi:hypothetical protein